MTDLQQTLSSNGWVLTPLSSKRHEGYLTPPQASQFEKILKDDLTIQVIIEIGFNAGHSCELFLKTCPQLLSFYTFDRNIHPYVAIARSFFENHDDYKHKFHFIEGDSRKTLPTFIQSHPIKADLIYIDGGHSFDVCFQDICHLKSLSHPKTKLWIDDVQRNGVSLAIAKAVEDKIIQIISTNNSDSSFGIRPWVEAHYLF